MNPEQLFEKIREGLAFSKDDSSVLKQIADFYGLAHMSYLGINLGAATSEGPFCLSTYPAEWRDHYCKMGYFKKDPTIKLALESLLPLDWRTIEKPSPIVKRMFGEARAFGISETGLSVPIRGHDGEVALMTMTGDFTPQEWGRFKRENMGDLLIVAIHLHLMVTGSLERQVDRPALSPREIESLSWAAQGKTYRDIAGILRISERTVRFYLENARRKLDALSVTQAVARAISMRMIPPSF